MADRPSITDSRIDELDSQPTVAVRLTQPMAQLDLAAAFDTNIPLVASTIGAHGGAIAGAPFARYHAFGPDEVDVEIGFPVVAVPSGLPELAAAAPGEVGSSELPSGPVARAMHHGSYDGLSAAYDALHAWIHEQPGYDDGPAPWESYVDDPMSVDDSEVRTEISWPLVRA